MGLQHMMQWSARSPQILSRTCCHKESLLLLVSGSLATTKARNGPGCKSLSALLVVKIRLTNHWFLRSGLPTNFCFPLINYASQGMITDDTTFGGAGIVTLYYPKGQT